MVGGMTYRNPAFLAKAVTGLDVISQGRAIWGIGAGWFELEHDQYGYEFGTFTDRFEKLEEGLTCVPTSRPACRACPLPAPARLTGSQG